METKTLLKEFSQYVILNICGMIGLSCYILADTFFVSNGLGANGLTALNLAIPIYSFVHGSGLMFGMGGATKYSIYRGQKEYKNADKSFSSTIYIMSALAVIFMLTGILFSEQLTRLLGADKNVYHMTKTYLQVILLFAPAFMANDTLICFVRNDGNPKLSMIGMLTGSFSNIILDYIFIFPLNMGIFGAVLATGLAPVISLIVLSKHWLTKQNQFHFVQIKPSFRLIGNIISLGVPSFITEMASGIVMIVFNTIILHLQGNIGVAAYGVVANLSLVVISIYTGIAQGTQPILSRVYGYGNYESQKQILKYALKTMLVISFGIYLFFLLAASPIVNIFNSEQNMQLQEIATSGLKLYFAAIPFVGFNIIISAYFTSTEKALPAQIISLSRGFLMIIPMAFFLSFILKMTGVWLSFPVTECFVALAGIALYIKSERGKKMFREMRRKKQILSEKECIEILEKGTAGVLALLGDNDYPYAVPISYVYYNSKLFFHGAKSGHKIDAIKKCSKASFCVIDQDHIVPEEYTTYFRSVIAFGKIHIMEDETEMKNAIERLAVKYYPTDTETNRNTAINREWKPLCMIELDIEHLSGKEAIELAKIKR